MDPLSIHPPGSAARTSRLEVRSRRSPTFHVFTPVKHVRRAVLAHWRSMDARDEGIVAGVLMSEGSFGGDGKQPDVILRKHIRHESLMRWLVARFPRSRLYGPYHHGERSYYQWVARGPALVSDVLPVLDAHRPGARRPCGRPPRRDARSLRDVHRAAGRRGRRR